jgi:hypothetical protein
MLDNRGLIPYTVDSCTGEQFGPSRGVGNSYVLIFAHELWPDLAKRWYRLYEEYFWQSRWWAAGFREFPRDLPGCNWLYDVDAGPIIAGFSPAANAFGLAAAKVNGRLDHAFTLTAQVLTACWPLPDGTLLGARILSNAGHAPHLGAACILFFLSQRTAVTADVTTGGHLPGLVFLGLLFYLGIGASIIASAAAGLRRWRRNSAGSRVPAASLQSAAWMILILAGIALIATDRSGAGAIAILLAQFFPAAARVKPKGVPA